MIKQIHIIHCDEVKLSEELAPEIVNRIETKKISEHPSLKDMQQMVDGLIQVYPARLPKLISLLPDSKKCQDMIINEEGRFTKPINKIATNIAYEIFGADKITGKIPETNQIVLSVHGTCFITDNWRLD